MMNFSAKDLKLNELGPPQIVSTIHCIMEKTSRKIFEKLNPLFELKSFC
jgi:hypothetical protein